jgi:2-dehydro-3-deoxygluconokinase
MDFDLIAVGETMVALAPPHGDSLRGAACWLVDHAGAESNTCVGVARLGLRAAWVSRLGDDAAGARILDALAAEGVDTPWVRRDPQRPTGLMLKDVGGAVRYYRTGSAASVMGPEILDGVPAAQARAVLVTGVTALLGEAPHAAGLALLEAARGLRIVDPNLRTGLWGSDRRAELVLPFIERCDLLLAGAGELEEIFAGSGGSGLPAVARVGQKRARAKAGGARASGRSRGSGGANDIEALARKAADCGPREVVVRGATTIGALADGSWSELDIRRGAAVDPIGAGDAFNAGYIAARLSGRTVDAALRAGARCGAAVTATPSDTAGFPQSLE